MCGRYHFGINDSPKAKKIKERAKKLDLTYKTGEVFPGDRVLCVMPVGSDLDLSVKKWGMKRQHFQINARIESLSDHPSYRDIRNRRCALFSDGFYEWDKDKNKFFISFRDRYLYLAAVYSDEGELLVVTREADEDFRHIHEREPLIMDEEEMKRYIHGEDPIITKKDMDIIPVSEEIRLF